MSIREVSDEVEPTGGEPAAEEYAGPAYMPVPVYTYAILACLAAVFVAQIFVHDSNDPFFLIDQVSARRAGFDKQAFLHAHQYWRILTGATVHSGILHFAMNSYAMYSFGRIFELLTNRAHLAIVFLIAAISGGVLSLIFLPQITSIGASGGIIGLVGYLAVYTFKRRQFISPQFRKALLTNIIFIFLFGLALWNVIDNYGHLGGIIAGAVYGLVQIPRDPYVNPADANRFTQIAGLICLGVFIATSIFSILLLLRLV